MWHQLKFPVGFQGSVPQVEQSFIHFLGWFFATLSSHETLNGSHCFCHSTYIPISISFRSALLVHLLEDPVNENMDQQIQKQHKSQLHDMDMRESCFKKYLFKIAKRAGVGVERVAYGHTADQWQKQRKGQKRVSRSVAPVTPSPCQWSSKSAPTEARVDWEIQTLLPG